MTTLDMTLDLAYLRLISRLNLTQKQYYSRISDLTDAGLIQRKAGKFLLTSLGKVVYEAHVLIGKAVQQTSNLRAIDSIEFTEFPNSELVKVIDTLITNDNIKQILINRHGYNNLENEKPLQQTAYGSVQKAVLESTISVVNTYGS